MKGMIKRGSVAGFFFEIVDQTTKHEVHMGILICGLNGSGKSTLGKMLADRIGYDFIDNEDLFFPKTDHAYAFSDLRSKDEVIRLLEEKIENNSRFVYAAVKGDYGKKLIASLECIVLIDVPKEIRRQRVRERSFSKFGERILPGGDLYDRETAWFSLTDSRPEDYTTQLLVKVTRCHRNELVGVVGEKVFDSLPLIPDLFEIDEREQIELISHTGRKITVTI